MKNSYTIILKEITLKYSYIFFLIMCLVNYQRIYSQNVNTYLPIINNIPSSPEAALLGKFGDVPIGHYTGTADISIPLYTIKESSLEIPIYLRYHSSGIKVSDEATWVGLGWDLSPGGAIIEEVRGNRDDTDINLSNINGYANFKNRLNSISPIGIYKNLFQKGRAFYESTCPTGNSLPPVTDPDDDSSEIVGNLLLGNGDPDIYHYSFSKYSGKFYINYETNKIVQIDKKEPILFEKNGQNSITATTPDGIVYYFNIVETAYYQGNYKYGEKSGKTFKLGSIKLTNGKIISFTYTDTHFSKMYVEQFYNLTEINTSNMIIPKYTFSQNDGKILSEISTPNEIIRFNLEDREDINIQYNDNQKRLKSIDIISKINLKKIKSYEFSYDYFPYNYVGVYKENGVVASNILSLSNALGKRLKLNSLKEVGYDNNELKDITKPPFQFEYEISKTMPLKISTSVDFYGYYNGEDNNGLLADLDYFDLEYENKMTFLEYPKSNRYTNNDYSGTYLLKKIIYPTGGKTEFEFEPNTFSNKFIPCKTDIISKSNTIQDKNMSNDNTHGQFQLSKSTNVTFHNSIYGGYSSTTPIIYNYFQMLGSYIELIKVDMSGGIPKVTNIKKWELANNSQTYDANNGNLVWDEKIRLTATNPNEFYSVNVHLPDNLVNNSYGTVNVKSNYSYYDDTSVNTSRSFGAGVRIKSIKNYDYDNKQLKNKSFYYFEDKLLNPFLPVIKKHIWENNCIVNPSPGPNEVAGTLYESERDEISISSNFENQVGNLVGYGRVEEVELDNLNSDNIGKKVLKFLNFGNDYSHGFYVLDNLKNGLLYEESLYNKLGDLLSKTNYSYNNLYSSIQCFYGLKIQQNFRGNSDPKTKGTGVTGSKSKYSYLGTPILSEWNVLSEKNTIYYFGKDQLTTSESYTYNNFGKIKTITITNSNNELFTTKYFYPNDSDMSSKPYAVNLTNINNIENPLVIQNFRGNEKLSEKETQYSVFGNLALPNYIFASKGSSNLEKKLTYDFYDTSGNLTQYTPEGGSPVSIVWGYNKTQPIAKIENATNAQLVSALGVSDFSAITEAQLSSLNNLRTNSTFTSSMITTYTYQPLVGISSITDPKGDTVYYTYDGLGRLQYVKDAQGKLLTDYQYHYKN